MKRLLPVLLLSILSFISSAQTDSLQGKWQGIIASGIYGGNKLYKEFTVYFKQSGKALWGIYMKNIDTATGETECTGRLTAKLHGDKNIPIEIYNNGTEEYSSTLEMCNFLHFLSAEYVKQENGTFLLGKWYSGSDTFGVGSGVFIIEKVSNEVDINVDSYFPNLARLIRNFNEE